MTEEIYLKDSYIKEFDGTVVSVSSVDSVNSIDSVNEKDVIMDKTIFYPAGGGQPCDNGKLIIGEEIYNVVSVNKCMAGISHSLDSCGLKKGDRVHGIIDWGRRYALMRMHTAAHVLASILYKETDALITGNQLGVDKSRIDFSLEKFDRGIVEECINIANELFKEDIKVRAYELPRAEALRIPGAIKLANKLPPEIKSLRIVNIEGVDKQIDGGTHVRNLNEVKNIKLSKVKNKGMNNRRVYFVL